MGVYKLPQSNRNAAFTKLQNRLVMSNRSNARSWFPLAFVTFMPTVLFPQTTVLMAAV